jgi:ABC-type nitrate/sulfonate/bicarbonate transport system substrate-binding protein
LAVSLAAIAVVVAACGSDNSSSSSTTAAAGGATTASGGGAAADLSKTCPNPLVVQTDWYPEVDHWELYAVADPASADIKGDRTVADMVDPRSGQKTGVKIEIRNGGPATQFELPVATMYKDPNIFLGYVNTDTAVQFAKDKPTVAVMAPRETSPQIIMWDPATYPDVTKIADLKAKNAKVRYFKDATYMAYLLGSGILSPSQVDDSYDGKPDAFVADGGKAAQQGFATAEPYLYQNEIKQWAKPVKYQLVSEAGWDYYAEALATKPENLTKYADCLKAVVPMFQAAQAKMQSDPKAVEDFIVKVVNTQNAGWVYSAGEADAAVKASLDAKVVTNGTNKTVGDFDDAKTQAVIDKATPIFKAQGVDLKDGLKPSDITTNQFIDTSIGLRS